VRIVFEGNDLFATDSLKVLMRLKEGQPLDASALDQDVELLSRFFERIQVVQEAAPGGVILKFRVSENPLVVELRVFGAAEIPEAEIREMLHTKVGQPLFAYQLAADADDVEEAYRQRGFHFVHVPDAKIVTLPSGGRRVEFFVVEGPKVEVEKIVFRGNVNVEEKRLRETMRTKESGLLSFLSPEVYREALLREDLVALTRLYNDQGFLDAEVVLDDRRFSDDKERVTITIAIVEHQPYAVGNVTIEIVREPPGRHGSPPPGDVAYFTEARLREWLGLVPGRRYSGEAAKKGREKVREEYFRRSYLDAQVDALHLRGRERDLVVDVELKVKEGLKYRLRRLDFVGNEYTRDRVLRREARISPGGYVDRNELERGLARLRRTRFFSRVTMDVEDAVGPDGEPLEGWKDAQYEIVEDKTGKLTFQVGVSTSGGVFGAIQFQKRNFDIARPARSWDDLVSGRAFTGAGQTFDILIAPSTREVNFAVGFTEPHFFGSEWSFGTRVYKRYEFRESYIVDRLGYTVGFGYPVYRAFDDSALLTANLRWRHEEDEIRDLGSAAVPGAFLFEGEQELRSLRATAQFRTYDDIRNPILTTDSSLSAELGGTFLGGDIDFVKLEAEHTQTWVLHEDREGKKQKLTARGILGWARALEDTPEVPPYERYFAGGNDFRGFAFRGVGPHVGGNPTGGEWELIGSLEYEYPIISDTLAAVAFVDAGTLATALDEDDAFRWRLSTGFGFRLKVPGFGDRPLAFDFGFPILDEAVDERRVVSFSVGRDF
jgi:outer membrane protein insertion porin family